VDSVLLAVGTTSVDALSGPIRELGCDVYTVGDSRSPRTILDAIREGFEAGLAI